MLPNKFGTEYHNKYNSEKYYSPKLSIPNKYKAILQAKGKEYGSMTKYFIHLIEQDLNSGDLQ